MNSSGEPPIGCLGKFLRMLGISPKDAATPGPLPYRLRDDFMSAAERSFYGVLVTALGPEFVVCPKINVADILYVPRPHENRGAMNRINRKHVDFLVCDAATMRPLLAVELDDSSHSRADRKERDEFMDSAFGAAGFPLLHVSAKQSYSTVELKEMITRALKCEPAKTPAHASVDSVPQCPKCGIPMVKRLAKQGDQAGQSFWGCSNYPKCRQTVAIE